MKSRVDYSRMIGRIRYIGCVLALAFVVVGCSKVQEDVTVLEYENPEASLEGHHMNVKNKITIYHRDGIVSRSVSEQEVVGDEGSNIFLEQMAVKTKEEHAKRKLENFSYEYQVSGDTLTETTDIHYQAIDLESLVEDAANTDNIRQVVNEDFQVVYDRLVKVYTDLGYRVVRTS